MKRTVDRITYSQTKPFLLNVHYARRMPCITHAYGLFIDGVLSGVCTFGVPASHSLCIGVAGKENSKNVLELNRLVVCDETPNNASFLVGNALRQLPNGTFVVSYADRGGGVTSDTSIRQRTSSTQEQRSRGRTSTRKGTQGITRRERPEGFPARRRTDTSTSLGISA